MLKLSLINPYSSSPFTSIKPLDLRGHGISRADLKMSLGSPKQLTITYDTNLKDSWDFLSQDDCGIRLQSDDLDLAFVKYGENKVQEENGVVTSTFFDVSWKMKTNLPQIALGQTYTGSFATLLGQIDPNYIFTLIGDDKQIVVQRGTLDNFQLLQEACKQTKYTWRFNGLVNTGTTTLPEILIGDFTQIGSYSSDPKYATQIATNQSLITNYLDLNPVLIKIKGNPTSEIYTHCLAFGDSGSGASSNSILLLTDPSATYLDSGFPLVKLSNDPNGYWYIANTTLNKSYVKVYQKSVSLSKNSQNTALNQIVTTADAQKYVYNEALTEFRSKSLAGKYDFDVVYKKLFLEGNKLQVKYKEYQLQQDGSQKLLYDINSVQTVDSVTFDLQNIQN